MYIIDGTSSNVKDRYLILMLDNPCKSINISIIVIIEISLVYIVSLFTNGTIIVNPSSRNVSEISPPYPVFGNSLE